MMKILFIGDIVGKSGRRTLKERLPGILSESDISFVIANGENSAGGMGLTPTVVEEILNAGVNVITTGNHVWDKKEVLSVIGTEERLLRPLNLPPGVPGRGYNIYETKEGTSVAVINLVGRVFMDQAECPFRTLADTIETIHEQIKTIIVDFHAEATAEKKALLYFADGRVTAVLGTHTHVQTADSLITENGTAYITDVGMTGVQDSVIGMRAEEVLEKFLTGMPKRFEVAKGVGRMDAVIIEILAGKAVKIYHGSF